MPTRLTLRRIAACDSDDDRLSTADTKVKRPTIHAPIDIGSQNLRVRIMFMKRVGTPRSAMRSRPHTATSGSESRYPTRATIRSRTPPKLSAMAAVKYAPPAMPPRKKYQTIIISQCGVLSIVVGVPLPALPEREQHAQPDGQRGAD